MNDDMDMENKTTDDGGAMDEGMDKDGMDADAAGDDRMCASCGHSHAEGAACDCGCDA